MVNVNNEWGKLKEVVVGTVDSQICTTHGKDLHCINYLLLMNLYLKTNWDFGIRKFMKKLMKI